MMKRNSMALLLILVLSLSLLAGCGDGGSGSQGGEKIDTKVILVLEDGTEIPYDLHVTSGKTLREALYEAELISEDDLYAQFVENIDGHIASVTNDGVTWLPCDMDGNQIKVSGDAMSAFDSYIPEEGGSIKLVYYVVPFFDD